VRSTSAPASPTRCDLRAASSAPASRAAARSDDLRRSTSAGGHRDLLEDVADVERRRSSRRHGPHGGLRVVAGVDLGRVLDGHRAADQDDLDGRLRQVRQVRHRRQSHQGEGTGGADVPHERQDIDGRGGTGRHGDAAQSVRAVVGRPGARTRAGRGPRRTDRDRHAGGAREGEHGRGVAGRHLDGYVARDRRHPAEVERGAGDGVQQRQRVVDAGVHVEDHPRRSHHLLTVRLPPPADPPPAECPVVPDRAASLWVHEHPHHP
jgi:hypothetical protein